MRPWGEVVLPAKQRDAVFEHRLPDRVERLALGLRQLNAGNFDSASRGQRFDLHRLSPHGPYSLFR